MTTPETSDLLYARHTDLSGLVAMLTDQHARRLDVVASAGNITVADGKIVLSGTDPVIDADGVTDATGSYLPTSVCDEGFADKFGIPLAYLRRIRNERPELYDQNLNGWLDGDNRKFMIRCLGPYARAFLSNGYRIIDNLDVLTAALAGIKQSGLEVSIGSRCDLTERRMYVRLHSPTISVQAPELVGRYRDPRTGQWGKDRPLIFAGLVISNSEVGDGAFNIAPQLLVEVCTNGMTIAVDAMTKAHLGAKLSEGVITWSDDTQDKNLALITAQTRDAVTSFLSADYLNAKVNELSEIASTPVTDPVTTIEVVGKELRFDEGLRASILADFIKGADLTAGGILHAVTSVAQITANGDTQHRLERLGIKAMELAAAL